MYTIDQVRRGLSRGFSNPRLFLRELNRLYYAKSHGPGFNREGVDLVGEDWDTLIILDACRYDLFKELHTLSGTLEKRTSRGSHTTEFLRGNFQSSSLLDTVYTTSTPQVENAQDELDVEFHAENHIWKTDRWDESAGTVPPSSMATASIDAISEFPHKRHIIHFVQPHYPFIGSKVDAGTKGLISEDSNDVVDIWGNLFRGSLNIDPKDIWNAYRHNFILVIDSVKSMLESIEGRTVITSDHGNMIGERSAPIPVTEWGHPPGIYTNRLVTVPWLVHESGERRNIIKQEGPGKGISENSKITERLESLGYK